jgi:hypothetical protein
MSGNDIYTDLSYTLKNVCRQRRNRQSFNVPSTRLNLQDSPYNQYTMSQLNMRRKVEILKYSSNRMNSQTNNLTRSQKWANIVSGVTASATSSAITPEKPCNRLPGWSSGCNIPGPLFQLYEDTEVPLYNFKQDQRSFSVYPDAPLLKWSHQVNNNVYISSKTDEIVSNVITRLPSESLRYNYRINIPIALFFTFTIPAAKTDTLIFTINSIELRVYYNDDKISTYPVTSSIKDISQNIVIRNTDPVNYYTLDVFRFIGNVSHNNIVLYNDKQYVYNIKLYVEYSLISTDRVVTNLKSNIIANYVTTESNINSQFSIPENVGNVTVPIGKFLLRRDYINYSFLEN